MKILSPVFLILLSSMVHSTVSSGDEPQQLSAVLMRYKSIDNTETQKIPQSEGKLGAVSIPEIGSLSPVSIVLSGTKSEKTPIEAFYQVYEPIGDKLIEKIHPLKVEYDKKQEEFNILIDAKSMAPGRRYLVQFQVAESFQKEFPAKSGRFVLLIQNKLK